MSRTYKTASGTFSEEDMVVAVWSNPRKRKARPNARLLETFTSDKSIYPIAFPLSKLQTIKSWSYCPVAKDSTDIQNLLTPENSSREKPILIPLTLAKSYLGWLEFYIPTEYAEVR